MFVANSARQPKGVSEGSRERGPIRSRRVTVLRAPAWIFVGLLLLFSAPFVRAATLLPLDIPLRFGVDKTVEFPAEIARHRIYYLDVAFPFRDAQERAHMSRIVGEPTRICKISGQCGVPTAFVIIIKKGNDLVLREEKNVFGRYSFDVKRYYRNIITIPLRPGNYTIIVEPTNNANELANLDAFIELSTDARSSDLED
jgi:hypothetical protein